MVINIYVNAIGNGTAYSSNDTPNQGDTFTLYCIPDVGETLENVEAIDGNSSYVAVAVQQEQQITLSNVYDYGGSITFTATFSEDGKRRIKRMPIWMYPCLRG